MDDLIRRSDVERWILTESACIDTPADRDAVVDRMRYSIPAVDAVEVRHGHWVEKWSGNGWNEWVDCTCSACKTEFERFEATKYCPECGARMDGRREYNLYESIKTGLEEAIAYERREDGDGDG